MKITKIFLFVAFMQYIFLNSSAQLAVVVSPPKISGQKAIVKLVMQNHLAQKIDSARAICFLLDDHGKMLGQTTKWVIGQNQTGMVPGETNQFDFIITSRLPFADTNLTAKISFSRLVLSGGNSRDPRQSIIVIDTKK